MANLTNSSKLIEKIESLEPIEYNAGEGIEIKNGLDYSAIQGPCPDGFHVPLTTEWQGVKTIMDGLSITTSDNWSRNLHMPHAGARDHSSASIVNNVYHGNYWSSSPYRSDYPNEASYLLMNASEVYANYHNRRTRGFSVRCFKNSYVAPDSTWTVIQGTLGSAGIFWNQSEGLISITDGTTGYTMMDKNLGATTVYSFGDTLSEANCGKYYQWGNNYGFDGIGGNNPTTSSTQVDASAYGPGNYYSSSTFITGNKWDSSNNDNLRGGETGVVTFDNAITNTGVLSVNGQIGDVTIASPDMSNYLAKDNTTTFTPTGDYQPATKKYVDDNAGAEYNAGEGILIGEVCTSISDMKGPAPDGFHVPLITEWEGLKTIMDGLSLTTGDNWRVNLHIPFAGYRDLYGADTYFQGSYGRYWSSSPYGSDGLDRARALYLYPDEAGTDGNITRASGYTVRCFKDIYVAPDSSWTVVQGNLGSSGIFWDQSKGLISITNGTTGYTIMDKNLGATTVYNDGDTLSEANCGKYYQWGNNYGFPRTGRVTTSETQVDASAYGPTNPYSSDTFIIDSYDWSSVHNDNLWGGVSKGSSQVCTDNVITNTGVLSVNGQTGDVTIQTGSEQNLFIITEGIVTVSTSENMGVAPYSTSYKYTNFDIDANAGIEWKEGAIYTFVVNTKMVVASAYRNVRVRIGSGAYIPVMGTTTAVAGNSYFAKTNIRQFQYTTKYESGGALHVFTDSNTTYKAMTAEQATAGTATTALLITPAILKGAITTHAPSYTAGNGINITNKKIGLDGTYEQTVQNYSAMQGPAPSGFHVPLKTEWQGLKTTMTSLSLNTTSGWRINLHMPLAGTRECSSSVHYGDGSYGMYWSSSPNASSLSNAYILYMSSYINADYDDYRTYGLSVRCFKDLFEIPTSSWTVINGTLGGAGIFWNQTDGLISITSDGTTGYTIMDKNLGATTVYNDGDTVSEANGGKLYQWGNNYGFPFSGNVTTSTTKVDATVYGPGNYYTGSTFIKGVSKSYNRDSSNNNNLRGGVTGIQPITTSGNLVLGDKLYKIVTSTTAPASGTASNIITISTGSTKGLYVGTTKIV